VGDAEVTDVLSVMQVVSVDANRLVLEAFMLMKVKGVGGLPVVEGLAGC